MSKPPDVQIHKAVACPVVWEANRSSPHMLQTANPVASPVATSQRLEQAEGRAMQLGQNWEVAAWEMAHLGSCHLGKTLGKLSLGKNPLGKYLNLYKRVFCLNLKNRSIQCLFLWELSFFWKISTAKINFMNNQIKPYSYLVNDVKIRSISQIAKKLW